MSRPEKQIDWNLVDDLLVCGSPGTEIAAHFAMHPNTFYRRVEEKFNMSFSEYYQEKRQIGDALIRKAQFTKALGHNKDADNTMLIWLGKQRLGQREPEKETNVVDEKILENFDKTMNMLSNIQSSVRKSEDINTSNE